MLFPGVESCPFPTQSYPLRITLFEGSVRTGIEVAIGRVVGARTRDAGPARLFENDRRHSLALFKHLLGHPADLPLGSEATPQAEEVDELPGVHG